MLEQTVVQRSFVVTLVLLTGILISKWLPAWSYLILDVRSTLLKALNKRWIGKFHESIKCFVRSHVSDQYLPWIKSSFQYYICSFPHIIPSFRMIVFGPNCEVIRHEPKWLAHEPSTGRALRPGLLLLADLQSSSFRPTVLLPFLRPS